MCRVRLLVLFFLALWALAAWPANGATVSARNSAIRPSNNALAARGFQELYNADYDWAVRDFTQLVAEYPDDPFPQNYLTAALLFQELNRLGALDSELYSSPRFLTANDEDRPPPLDAAVQKKIFALIAQVESRCSARIARQTDDVDAYYARGVARGFRATYLGLAQHSWGAALRASLGARRDHEFVLTIDPSYLDAKTTVGIHLYIVGSLNWAGRLAAALIGAGGNRSKGLQYLREVSRGPGTSNVDAAMALALFLRREQRYDEALALVQRLTEVYPRNFLLALEYAQLLNAAGRGREAVASYRRVLDTAQAGGYSSSRLELAYWGWAIALRGQHEFAAASQAFAAVASSARPARRAHALLAEAQMYDTLGQRTQAVSLYQLIVAEEQNKEAVQAAQRALKHPYQFRDTPSPRYPDTITLP